MFHGAITGALSTGGNTYIKGLEVSDGIKILASSILGGTVSEIGGGKFANGAITSAFHMMFNDLMHQEEDGEKTKKVYNAHVEDDNEDLNNVIGSLCFAAGGALLADDCSGIGVVDDPLAAAFFAVGVYLTVENVSNAWENLFGNKTRMLYSEHRSNVHKSNKPKHQEGQSRKMRDNHGGEKGDKRRKRYK